MDVPEIKAFNAELSGLYENRPPISKAKMSAITRGAIMAIKFYKHVVHSVEKFIQKCKPEYKVPGLYVIDSIVKQSRHQFGQDKDVFAPRFAKNMKQTVANLIRCPDDDKRNIIRVLKWWQETNVFSRDVIQPLLDMADPNHPLHMEIMQQQNNTANGNGRNVSHNTSDNEISPHSLTTPSPLDLPLDSPHTSCPMGDANQNESKHESGIEFVETGPQVIEISDDNDSRSPSPRRRHRSRSKSPRRRRRSRSRSPRRRRDRDRTCTKRKVSGPNRRRTHSRRTGLTASTVHCPGTGGARSSVHRRNRVSCACLRMRATSSHDGGSLRDLLVATKWCQNKKYKEREAVKEKQMEREKKGLPPIKKLNLNNKSQVFMFSF